MVKVYGYNKTRKEAFQFCDLTVKRNMPQGILRSNLVFDCVKESGLTDRIFNKYIDDSIDNDVYEESKGVIKWKLKNARKSNSEDD